MKQSFMPQLLSRLILPALLVSIFFARGQAGVPPKEIAVGMHAPAFTLKDQNDREFSLDEMQIGRAHV